MIQVLSNLDVILSVDETLEAVQGFVINAAAAGNFSLGEKAVRDSFESEEMNPVNWPFVKVEDVAQFTNGYAFRSQDYRADGVGIIRMSDLKNGEISIQNLKYVPHRFLTELSPSLQVKPNDLVLGMSGSIGRPCFNRTEHTFLLNQRVGKLTPQLDLVIPEYLAISLANLEQHFLQISMGSAIKNLSTAQIKQATILLPPLGIQKLIAENYQEFLLIKESLKSALIYKKNILLKLQSSAINALSGSQTQIEFQDAWKRIDRNWKILFSSSKSIDALRSLVLELEMKKHLSTSRTSDLKNSKWSSAALGEICEYIQRGKGPTYSAHGSCKIVSQKCVQWKGFDPEPTRFLEESSLSGYGNERFLRNGDLLWNSTGTGTVGRTALFRSNDNQTKFVADSHVTVLRSSRINHEFLYYWSRSPEVQAKVLESTTGSTNQQELNLKKLKELKIYFPDLATQQQTVQRINVFFALCDQLEDSLRKSESLAEKISNSLFYKSKLEINLDQPHSPGAARIDR